jgi:hypothetical protein
MSAWFHPYRYIDAELRAGPVFDSLASLGRDLNRWRRDLAAPKARCTTTAERFDNGLEDGRGEEAVAVVRVDLINAAGEVVASRSVLTAGEEREQVLDALRAASALTRKVA